MSATTARISEFSLGKGISATTGKDGPWKKAYFEVTIKLPEQLSEENFAAALVRAEYVVDNYLGNQTAPTTEATQIPDFDPQILTVHEWKGKKIGEGQYDKGSTSCGWDFQDKFPPEVIKVLEKGPLTIDRYEFVIVGTLVQAHEKKNGKRRHT